MEVLKKTVQMLSIEAMLCQTELLLFNKIDKRFLIHPPNDTEIVKRVNLIHWVSKASKKLCLWYVLIDSPCSSRMAQICGADFCPDNLGSRVFEKACVPVNSSIIVPRKKQEFLFRRNKNLWVR
jgi:hypothetical protein